MANAPEGNNFIEGEMGVVLCNFDGIELGKTMDEASLEFIEDIKDIMYAQLGTQPADKFPTGQAYQLTCKLGETTLVKLKKLMRGLTVNGNNAKLGADMYRSGYKNFAKRLIVTRVDSDGNASIDPHHKATFYKAFPIVSGAIGGPFGPDTQRGTDVTFYIFKDRVKNAFGFIGTESSAGL